MQLYVQTAGQALAPALIFIHGLFGTGDNWHSIAQYFANDYHVIMPDLRNHGRSPHSDHQTYSLMADDLHTMYQTLGFAQAHIVGHSLGGKVAMVFANKYPNLVKKLTIVDMANKAYADEHTHLIDAMLGVDLSDKPSRNAVDNALKSTIPNSMVRQFLLMNLVRGESGFSWRINLTTLKQNYPHLQAAVCQSDNYAKPCLVIRGAKSDYIQTTDFAAIQQTFTNAALISLETDHWVHAEAPEAFVQTLTRFLATA